MVYDLGLPHHGSSRAFRSSGLVKVRIESSKRHSSPHGAFHPENIFKPVAHTEKCVGLEESC
jgi:hypothetical protein